MNYFLHYKFLLISSFCVVALVLYVILVDISSSEDQLLLLEEPYSNGLPCSLNMFNFARTAQWRDLPKGMKEDLFTCSPLYSIPSIIEDDLQCAVNLPAPILPEIPFPLCLNGWSGINEKLIFVFSTLNSNKTFIGTVGDSFENPAFTIVSFDFKTIQDEWNLHSVPVVTILDKELNRLVTLAPALCNNSLNAIHH